jgi:hypothetical protein
MQEVRRKQNPSHPLRRTVHRMPSRKSIAKQESTFIEKFSYTGEKAGSGQQRYSQSLTDLLCSFLPRHAFLRPGGGGLGHPVDCDVISADASRNWVALNLLLQMAVHCVS